MQRNELIKQITQTNEAILFEFADRIRGVIHNRHNKSKGFQFALLDKNLNELMDLVANNNQHIRSLE